MFSARDVRNVSDPVEMSKCDIEGDWSDTPVLTEHKASVFDKSKQLPALPVSTNSSNSKTASIIPRAIGRAPTFST